MKTMLLKSTRNSFGAVLLAAAALLGGGAYSPPAAAIGCPQCSTFVQQLIETLMQVDELMEAAKTAEESAKTNTELAQQYSDMLKQGTSLPNSILRGIDDDLSNIVGIYNNTRAIGKHVNGLENRFKSAFKDYESYLEVAGEGNDKMPERYEQWAAAGFDNARTAMLAAGMNVSSFASETEVLGQMVSRSQSAVGRLQAIQAGNEIAAQNVQQLQMLRDMMQTQIAMQANNVARTTQKEAVDDAFNEKFYSVRPNNSADQEF